jgi:hypothetical protein
VEPDVYYKIVDAKVAHEIIDGEAIVIHFDTGNYYSLEGISSQLWQWFASQASRQQILDAFQDLQPDQIQSLDAFIESLIKEEILALVVADAEHQSKSPLPKHEVQFQLPKFAKYNDMQNLLLSDPIHDTDETGWPNLEENSV